MLWCVVCVCVRACVRACVLVREPAGSRNITLVEYGIARGKAGPARAIEIQGLFSRAGPPRRRLAARRCNPAWLASCSCRAQVPSLRVLGRPNLLGLLLAALQNVSACLAGLVFFLLWLMLLLLEFYP